MMRPDAFAVRWLAAIAPALPPAAAAELRRGHAGSRVLREALADIASTRPVAVLPSRAELERAMLTLAADRQEVAA